MRAVNSARTMGMVNSMLETQQSMPQLIAVLQQYSDALGQAILALKDTGPAVVTTALRVAQDDADRRKRLSEAMKARWRKAKRAGQSRLTKS